MILYYKSPTATCKLHVDQRANPAQIDALMARDDLIRCTRAEWLDAKNRQSVERDHANEAGHQQARAGLDAARGAG